ncbi:macrophage mannose receptor 1-like [Cloeon dipterum]|uniref:macrophage mannose receptor 1-like n=1 Tax=Cloeon dipterum TaxID=197152 RepID=UPI0032203FDA
MYPLALAVATFVAADFSSKNATNHSLLRYPIHKDDFEPSLDKTLHKLEKRSPRRTVIVITKQKRRFQIIKCCGMVRCSKTSKNSTRFLKTTKTNQKPPKPKITAPGGGTFPPAGKEPPNALDPLDPANLSNPSDPVDPSNPEEPSNSKTPSSPEDPSNSPNPEDPMNPEVQNPLNQTDPFNPIIDPKNPANPLKTDPLNPGGSDPPSTAGPNSPNLASSNSPSNTVGMDPKATEGAGLESTITAAGGTSSQGVTNTSPRQITSTLAPGATTVVQGASTVISGATTVTPGGADTTPTPALGTRSTMPGPGATNTTTLPSDQTPPTTTPPRPPCFESKSNYTLSTEKQTWANARLECQKKGMDLVNMETTEENTCVKFIIENAKQTATPFWQALNKIGLPSYSQWLSGQSLTYTDWNSGAPAKIDTEDCSLISGGKWIGASCTDTYNYVCETPQPFDMCTNEQPVEISSTKLSFDDARAECQRKKMDLVSLETRDQNTCFQKQLTMLGLAREPVYIGLTMTGNTNYTTWVNAKPLLYLDWAAGNPAQFGTEKCVQANNFHWFDVACTEPLRYACEDAVVLDPCFSMTTKHVLSNDTASWAVARLNCKKLGMELTSMETPQENICVKSILKSAGITAADRVWHSLNMFGQPNYDSWNNGEPLTYNDWAPGNPAQIPWESCGAFEYGRWGDVPCSWKLRYVCESAQIDPCDPDQFVASTSVLTFDAAVIECRKNGMALSVPETREENICIQRLLDEKGLTNNFVWNGLNKKGASNYTKWYNEAPLTYLDWNRGEPAQFPHEQCGMHFFAHWYDLPCELSAYYVCEKTIVIDPCKGLPSTYKVSTDTKTWGGARAECKKQGGDLVSIDSAKEHACVKDKIDLAGKTTSIVFHGLNKMGWSNYTSLYSGSTPTATYWKSGEPAQFKTEHCSAYKDGAWMDVDCKGSNAYVCESPAPIDVCSKYSFSVSTEARVYDDARFECLKKNMTIVDLDNPSKSMCLQQYIAGLELSSTPLTIGLDKRRTLNHTKWSNGELLTFTDWDVNNPEAFASEHCAVALNHHWHDSPCGVAYRYVCEDDYKDPCADFSTYTIVTNNNKNWVFASDECKKLGGDLVSMETPEENFCVRYKIYLAGKKDERMWHSLSKLGTVYFKQWANGEPLTYSDFVPGYNLKSWTGEHCGGFESGIWGDIPCTWEIPYVCESNPSPKEICINGQFEVYAMRVNYATSLQRCNESGTALANMETVTENICVQRAILRKGAYNNWVYAGLNKIGQTNYTKWENGAALTYSGFPPGEPAAFLYENCIFNTQVLISCGCLKKLFFSF